MPRIPYSDSEGRFLLYVSKSDAQRFLDDGRATAELGSGGQIKGLHRIPVNPDVDRARRADQNGPKKFRRGRNSGCLIGSGALGRGMEDRVLHFFETALA